MARGLLFYCALRLLLLRVTAEIWLGYVRVGCKAELASRWFE